MTADLKVIGAGFGRTGTDSMREALEILGFGPCHHMRALQGDDAHRDNWMKAIESGQHDWDLQLGGFNSSIDWPSAHYWPELIERFPKAKILLTLRSAESWWASFEKTILASLDASAKTGRVTPGTLLTRPHIFGGKPLTRENGIAAYEDNTRRVLSTVPADRRLTYTIGDGWGPLCAFLNVDVPDRPFPRSNSSDEFSSIFK